MGALSCVPKPWPQGRPLDKASVPQREGNCYQTTTNEPCSAERTFVASTRGKKGHKEGGCRAQGRKAQEEELEVVSVALWWSVLG